MIAMRSICAGLVLASIGFGQNDIPVITEAYSRTISIDAPGISELLSVGGNDLDQPAQVIWRDYKVSPVSATVLSMPFQRVSDVWRVDDQSFLVAGIEVTDWPRQKGRGVLSRVVLDRGQSTISVVESKIYPSLLFGGAAWINGTLFVTDIASDSVRATSWQWPSGSGTNSLPAETALQVVAQDPRFAPIEELALGQASDQPSGVSLVPRPAQRKHKFEYYSVYQDSGAWHIGVTGFGTIAVQQWRRIAGGLGHTDDIIVAASGGASGPFDIVSMETGAVVASGVLATGTQSVSVPAPTVFGTAPGQRYLIRGGQAIESTSFVPIVRYKAVAATSSALSASIGYLISENMVIGNSDFQIGAKALAGAKPQSPVQYTVVVNSAFRSAAGVDPIIEVGAGSGRYLLQQQASFSYSITSSDQNKFQDVDIPIPTDDSLDGAVVLFQILFVDVAGNIAASDVFGSRITGAMAAFRQPSQNSKSAARARFLKGLQSRGGGAEGGRLTRLLKRRKK